MKLRRLLALFTSVAMLHLAVVVGDAACPANGASSHGEAPRGALAAHAMDMEGRAGPAHVTAAVAASAPRADTADLPPCGIPAPQHCCEALAGCSAAAAVARDRIPLTPGAPLAMRIREARHDMPVSFASAPEPPPPKA